MLNAGKGSRMEIMDNRSCYVNPNTRALTSNIKNTVIKDREAFNSSMQSLLKPVENLAEALQKPIKLAEWSSLNRQENAVTIANGRYESQAESEANTAYEKLKANNRTYTFADERTKNQIAYISNYYLEHTTGRLQTAWKHTLEETGINPFPQGFSSTLSQLSMEQDFATGGNDDIFGSDMESNIAAVKNILYRIDNPLGVVPEKNIEFLENEKTFYTALLNNLT